MKRFVIGAEDLREGGRVRVRTDFDKAIVAVDPDEFGRIRLARIGGQIALDPPFGFGLVDEGAVQARHRCIVWVRNVPAIDTNVGPVLASHARIFAQLDQASDREVFFALVFVGDASMHLPALGPLAVIHREDLATIAVVRDGGQEAFGNMKTILHCFSCVGHADV